jgi:hypothetical protein
MMASHTKTKKTKPVRNNKERKDNARRRGGKEWTQRKSTAFWVERV